MIRCLRRIECFTSQNSFAFDSLRKRSLHSSRIRSKDVAETEANIVDKYLKDFQERLQSDASSRILASPLRRCSVTQIMLPRLLMFKMTSSRPLTSIDREEAEVNDVSVDNLDIRGESRNCNREKNLLLRRRSRRWLLKEKKKSKEQLLLRAQRMAQHKLVTSQTDLSRDRFQNQIAVIKARIKKLCLPPPLGHLLPFGLSKEAERRSNGVARGRGLWCSLNKRVVAASSKMTTHRMIPHTHPAPESLPEVLQEGLEIRAVEEARLLLQAISGESRNDTVLHRPLVRRLRGQEVRSLVVAGKLTIRDDEEANLACFLSSGGSVALLEEGPPMYDLDTVFADGSRRIAFQSLLRDIAIIMNKKQLKIKRSLKLPQYTLPHASSAHEKTARAAGDLDRRQKMPRLHLVRQDERTVNLCIALWRLDAWSRSR